MLGAGVDPRLFVQDYSGFANAGAMQGQAMANLGQSIASGIEGFQEKKKEQANIERQIKKADNVAKAISDLVPDLAPTIEALRAQLMDLNLPQNDRLAIAEGIGDILNIGLAEVKGRQERAFRNQELAMRYAPAPPEPIRAVGNPFKVRMQANGQEVDVEHVRLNDGRMVPLYEYQRMQQSQTADSIGQIPTNDYLAGIDSGAIDIGIDGEPMPSGVPLDDGMVSPPKPEPELLNQPGVTVVSDREKGMFRQATSQEAASYGAQAGQFGPDGKFYPINPPSGMSVKTNPDGTFELVQGSGTGNRMAASGVKLQPGETLVEDPASPTGTRIVPIPGGEAERQQVKKQAAEVAVKQAAVESATAVMSELDRFIAATDKMSRLPLASVARKKMATAGFQQQAEVENMLTTIRANLQFEQIAKMKEASPTGSTGLGAVTKPEFDALGATLGQLSQVGDPKVQKERALTLRKKFLDTIHGNQAHRDKLLKEGKVTQQQYDAIQSLYGGPQVSTPVENADRQQKIEEIRRRLQQQ